MMEERERQGVFDMEHVKRESWVARSFIFLFNNYFFNNIYF